MTNTVDKQSFGQAGCEIRTGAAFPAGDYCALQFVTAGTITALTAPKAAGTFTSITYPAGFVLYTPFTAATITGTAIAYRSATP
jgi:hypothetical protein